MCNDCQNFQIIETALKYGGKPKPISGAMFNTDSQLIKLIKTKSEKPLVWGRLEN